MVKTEKRVFVTGLGVISPVGCDLESYWTGLLHRESRPAVYEHTHPAYMKNRLFYSVSDLALPEPLPDSEPMGRASTFAVRATAMALRDAGIATPSETDIVGVAFGTGMGDSDLLEQEREGGPIVSPLSACFFRVSPVVADRFHLNGPNLSISTACSASGYSVGLARDAIVDGWADVMVAGGVEGFCRIAQSCFNRMGALDPQVCRPFDAERAGTLFGEGAAVLILESEEHARRRDCRHIYAELKGTGWSCDGYHVTAPDPAGRQAELAIHRALADASVGSDQIGCVIAHGTGTELNDVMESACLERVFGPAADQIPVCAVKSKLGHSGGAAGAFSCLTAALVLDRGLVPPTGNITMIDPRCRLKLNVDKPVEVVAANVLVNAYAFGGNNISLVMGRLQA